MPAKKEIASFKLPTTTLAMYQVNFLKKNYVRKIYLSLLLSDILYLSCIFVLLYVEVQYFHDHATVTSAVGLNQPPWVHRLVIIQVRRSAGSSPLMSTITVGGLYAVDPLTSAKYRLSNRGKFAALMQHELKLESSWHTLVSLTPRPWIRLPDSDCPLLSSLE
ncbi:hypothetical protein MKW92_002677 [Papaver armeniacum]|nr:hypothetical protein MKW92_002677 [Papaver armeniacum]